MLETNFFKKIINNALSFLQSVKGTLHMYIQEQNWKDNIKGKAVPLSPLKQSYWAGSQSVARLRAFRLADL